MTLFQRKPIAAESDRLLVRVLGGGDLIMLAIGAVIGAGIFGAIGSAAAGQVDAAGHVIRVGAGPALVLSFVLAAAACAFAGLCYAELASMIPQAGSAYAYSYATLGEIVAWIIGWDLILEYAVGNVAVAISWSDYFKSLVGDWVTLPVWLTTGYRTALLSPDPAVHGLLRTVPHIAGIPLLINLPAFTIVMLITWLLLLGVRESARVNNILVVVKLLVLGLFIVMGSQHINTANYHPFAPGGFKGIGHGGGRDQEPATQPSDRDSRRPGDLHGHLHHRRCGANGNGAIQCPRFGGGPAGVCAQGNRVDEHRQDCLAGSRLLAVGRVARVPVRPAADLFRDGPGRAVAAVGGEGSPEAPHSPHHHAGDRPVRGNVGTYRRCRRDL